MWLDVIAIAILAVFAWLGARRGALAAGMGLFALVAGYAAAIFLGPQLAPVLGGLVGESEWAGIAVAGSLAFAICFAAVSISH